MNIWEEILKEFFIDHSWSDHRWGAFAFIGGILIFFKHKAYVKYVIKRDIKKIERIWSKNERKLNELHDELTQTASKQDILELKAEIAKLRAIINDSYDDNR